MTQKLEIELKVMDLPELQKSIAMEIEKARLKTKAEILALLEGKGESHEDTKQHDGARDTCCHKSCSKEVR